MEPVNEDFNKAMTNSKIPVWNPKSILNVALRS